MSKSKEISKFARQIQRCYASSGGKKGQHPSRPVPTKASSPAPKSPTPEVPKPAEAAKDLGQATRPLPSGKPVPRPETSKAGPLGSGAGRSPEPPGKPAATNSWLFSPSLPVDVRLFAVGTVALGGIITYAYFRKVEELEHETPLERDLSSGIVDSPSAADLEAKSGSELQQSDSELHQSSDELQQNRELAGRSNFYTDELALEASDPRQESLEEAAEAGSPSASEGAPPPSDSASGATGSSEQAGSGGIAPQDTVIPLQGRNDPNTEAVAELLHSVLTNQIDLAKAEVDEDRIRSSSSKNESASAETTVGQRGTSAESSQYIEAAGKRADAEKKLQETLDVLKEGVAGSSGEAMLSSAAAQAKIGKRRQNRESEEVGRRLDVRSEESLEALLAAAKAHLGITDDLRPAALIRKAIERGEGSGENWEEYNQRLAQAAADSETFRNALKQALSNRQKEQAAQDSSSGQKDELIAELESALRDQAATFQQILKEEEGLAAKQREGELARQAEYLTTAFAEAALKERASRIQALDEVRGKLNGLHHAFGRRSQDAATSHGIHRLSLGVFALSAALEEGLPFSAEVDALRTTCSDDRLVAAALGSLPSEAAQKGLPTQAELLRQWPDVRRLSSQLSYLQPQSAGLIQLGLASLAARLKVKEVAQPGKPNSVDQALAHAEACLTKGHLHQAVSVLEASVKGTAAANVVSEWTRAVSARAVAEQALQLLQAHASSKEASLS